MDALFAIWGVCYIILFVALVRIVDHKRKGELVGLGDFGFVFLVSLSGPFGLGWILGDIVNATKK